MYEFLGITLVLALLLTINATATMVAAGFGRLCKPLLWKCSARTRAEILFVMRIGPPVIAIVAIAAFMIPSYLTYEPHNTNEFVSWKLGALAALSAIGVGSRCMARSSFMACHAFALARLAGLIEANRIKRDSRSDLRSESLVSDHRRCRRDSPAVVYRHARARIA